MKCNHKIYVAFCDHSWKIFQTNALALEWITDREKIGECWSITPGQVCFNLPRVK